MGFLCKNKGAGGEHIAMGDATYKGYIVSKTTESDLMCYDFVLDDGNKLYRVEVKTSDYGRGFEDRAVFNLSRRNTKITKYYYVDYFALVCPKLNKIAWIKTNEYQGRSRITIKDTEFKHFLLPENTILLKMKLNDSNIIDKQTYLFD